MKSARALVGYERRLWRMSYKELIDESARVGIVTDADLAAAAGKREVIRRILDARGIDPDSLDGPPEKPAVQPGRGVRMTEEEKHAWHHYRVADDLYQYNVCPDADRYRKRELGKKAYWDLKSHLAGLHGRRAALTTVGGTYAELAERHRRLHEEADG